MSDFTEDSLIEQPTIALFSQLGWSPMDCYYESIGMDGTLRRETTSEVVLRSKIFPGMQKFNPSVSSEALQFA